jgi:hypothetical protein
MGRPASRGRGGGGGAAQSAPPLMRPPSARTETLSVLQPAAELSKTADGLAARLAALRTTLAQVGDEAMWPTEAPTPPRPYIGCG